VNGTVAERHFRDERQMVHVIDEAKRARVLDYLASKR